LKKHHQYDGLQPRDQGPAQAMKMVDAGMHLGIYTYQLLGN
jgi:hypothetical protein